MKPKPSQPTKAKKNTNQEPFWFMFLRPPQSQLMLRASSPRPCTYQRACTASRPSIEQRKASGIVSHTPAYPEGKVVTLHKQDCQSQETRSALHEYSKTTRM